MSEGVVPGATVDEDGQAFLKPVLFAKASVELERLHLLSQRIDEEGTCSLSHSQARVEKERRVQERSGRPHSRVVTGIIPSDKSALHVRSTSVHVRNLHEEGKDSNSVVLALAPAPQHFPRV